jgi:hypothetical protein
MNSKTLDKSQNTEFNINESYFFKIELFIWAFCSLVVLLYCTGLSVPFPFIEILLQISVILLAGYAAIVPFAKSWYNLEDIGSALINLSGIILLTCGATASYIYQLEWGENTFMAGFLCTCYYHVNSPYREKTYQNTNEKEQRLIRLFVYGCLLSFPACFIHEDLFPYPSMLFRYASAAGFWLLSYTLLHFCFQWIKGNVRNYILLSYVPRLTVMLYFAKGYEQFFVLGTWLKYWH